MAPKRKVAVSKSEPKPVEMDEEEPVAVKPTKTKRTKKGEAEKVIEETTSSTPLDEENEDEDVEKEKSKAKKGKGIRKEKKAATKQSAKEEPESEDNLNGDANGEQGTNGNADPVKAENGEDEEDEEENKPKKGRGKPGKKAKEVKEPKAKKLKSEEPAEEVEKDLEIQNGNPSGSRRLRGLKKPNYSEEEVPKKRTKTAKGKTAKKEREDTPEDDENEDDEPKKAGRGAKGKAASSKSKETAAAPLNQTETNWEDIDFDCKKTNSKGDEYNLKVMSWNVDGLRAWLKKDGAKIFEYAKPDILCLQEIKCNEEQVPEEMSEALEGYEQYWKGSDKDGYAGVALFSKVKPINVTFGIGNDDFDDEGRCVTAEYENFYVVGVYVPNAGRKLVTLPKRLEWNDAFKQYLKDLDEQKPVIICGDMNVAHSEIDLANPKTNTKNAGFTKEEREGMTDFLESGFEDTYRKLYPDKEQVYTFWTYMMKARSKNVGWLVEDIIALERDFRYNLDLLRIRDSEIDKCNKVNKSLQENLDSALREIQTSKMNCADLKNELLRLESMREAEQEQHKRDIQKLQIQINAYIENENSVKRQHEKEIKRVEEQLKLNYIKQLNYEKDRFVKIKLDFDMKCEKVNKNAEHLKETLDQMVDKNIDLQNKVHRLETQIVADSSFYKTEIQNVQSKVCNLKIQVQGLSEENDNATEECRKLSEDNQILKEASAKQCDRIRELMTDYENIRMSNEQMQENLNNFIVANEDLQAKIKSLYQDKENLLTELSVTQGEKVKRLVDENENLKTSLEHLQAKLNRCVCVNEELNSEIESLSLDKERLFRELETRNVNEICNVAKHFSFDNVVQQNKVLQEVIKEMKKNRNNCQQEAGDLCAATEKIDRLEELVEQLKKVIVSNRGLKIEDLENGTVKKSRSYS